MTLFLTSHKSSYSQPNDAVLIHTHLTSLLLILKLSFHLLPGSLTGLFYVSFSCYMYSVTKMASVKTLHSRWHEAHCVVTNILEMQSVGNGHWRRNKSGWTFLNTVEWSWQQKDEVLVENPRPSAIVSTTGLSRTRLGLNPRHRGMTPAANRQSHIEAQEFLKFYRKINPYPTAFPYGNGMVLHFYQQQESSTTKTVHKVINKGLKTYV